MNRTVKRYRFLSVGYGIIFLLGIPFFGGCLGRVSLPDPPPYPSQTTQGEGEAAHLQKLQAFVQQREGDLWTRQTQCLGVGKMWGKLYFQLAWPAGGSLRCSLLRADLQADEPRREPSRTTLLKHLQGSPPSSVEGWRLLPEWRREVASRKSLCFAPCDLAWPAPSAGQAATFSFVLERSPPSAFTPNSPSSPALSKRP